MCIKVQMGMPSAAVPCSKAPRAGSEAGRMFSLLVPRLKIGGGSEGGGRGGEERRRGEGEMEGTAIRSQKRKGRKIDQKEAKMGIKEDRKRRPKEEEIKRKKERTPITKST